MSDPKPNVFQQALEAEMEKAKREVAEAFQRDMNRMLWGEPTGGPEQATRLPGTGTEAFDPRKFGIPVITSEAAPEDKLFVLNPRSILFDPPPAPTTIGGIPFYPECDCPICATGPSEPPVSTRESVLDEAISLITGDRNAQYGEPRADFQRTAALWQTYILGTIEARGRVDIQPHDVAVFQMLLKISRLCWSPTKRDHWVDIAGYAGCGAECALGREEVPG